ncbi:Uncharacterised protein [Vibrio cholerae]|nr:Uncharacterised protein [Vibrio cholerae]CSI48536.1 Uncharacterised protein [Vibrio cholerae]
MQMHILLWERNRNTFPVKAQLNFFSDIPIHIPVIVGFHPRTHDKVNR